MEDLKNELKINLNQIETIRMVLNTLENWENLLTSSETTNLEKFLLFKTASQFGLYKKGADDPDSTEKSRKHLKEKLEKIDEVDTVEVGKDIHKKEKYRTFKITLKDSEKKYRYNYNNISKEIYLESDTANSLMTDLGNFLRIIIKESEMISVGENWAEKTYVKEYGINETAEVFRNYYWYTLIPKLPDMLKGKEKEKACFYALEKRAALMHTLGNVILVPYGYNSKRCKRIIHKSKIVICDRLDRTIEDFEAIADDDEFKDEILQNELENKKASIDSVKFLLNHQAELFPYIPKYPKDDKDTIKWITEVSEAINKTLENAL